MSTRRRVTQFRKNGDESLVRDFELRGARITELRTLFQPGDDDPQMVLCYLVTERQRPAIERLLAEPLDIKKYDYYIEAYADSARVSRPRSAAAVSRD